MPFQEQGKLCWAVGKARPRSGESPARFGVEEILFQEWEKAVLRCCEGSVTLGSRAPGKAEPVLGARRCQKGFWEQGMLCQIVRKDLPGSRES